jgi:TetR/AcrR family transcriptional repressor of nem operon
MPWPKAHKSQTRQKIVDAAAAKFRAGGISTVRVGDVMAHAGLTHGGFYAHFASKDDLVRQALEHASKQTLARMSQRRPGTGPTDPFQALVDAYLSPGHVMHPEVGCPIASLGPEIVRIGGATHRSLAKSVKDRIAWMRKLVTDARRDLSDDEVIAALACMVGGIVLARIVGGKDSAVVLGACREFLSEHVGESSATRGRGGRNSTGRAKGTASRAMRRRTRPSSVEQ